MKLWVALLCLVALTGIASSAKGAALYSVVTEATATETLLWLVQIDTTSGAVTNVTEAMVYAGGSATIDGISTFYQTKGRYYWATNFEDAFVHEADVNKKQLLPPTDFGATEILGLNYDEGKRRLLTLFTVSGEGTFLTSSGSGIVNFFFQLPSSFDTARDMTSAVDETKQNYYLIVDVGKTSVKYEVATFDIDFAALASQVPLDDKTCGTLDPQFAAYDAESGNLIGSSVVYNQTSGSLAYFYTVISPKTGVCQMTALPVLNGIVTCWTYNPLTKELWFGEATDGGSYIYSYNTQSGQLSQPLLIKGYLVPESIEISYR